MRKGALLLAILMVAAAPTVAFAAKKAKAKKYDTKAANMNESSQRLVRDGISQIFVPAQSLMASSQKASKPKKAKKKKAKAKAAKAKKK